MKAQPTMTPEEIAEWEAKGPQWGEESTTVTMRERMRRYQHRKRLAAIRDREIIDFGEAP